MTEENDLYNRALALAEGGKFDEALRMYDELLAQVASISSLRAAVYNDIATIRHSQGSHAGAEALFRQAVFTDTLFMDAYRNLMALNAEKAKDKKKYRLSISIPTYNRCNELKRCIDSLRENSFYPLEIIVVCDPCNDGTVEYLKGEEGKEDIVSVINNERIGATRSWNIGLEKATGDYVALLNDDHEVMPGWDLAAILCIDDDETAGCGLPLIIYPGGKLQSAGQHNDYVSCYHSWLGSVPFMDCDIFHTKYLEHLPELQQPRECDYGYVPVMKRECFEKAGALDERYEHYFTDTDLGYKIQQAGYKNIYCPTAVVVHHDLSRKDPDLKDRRFEADRIKFFEKWGIYTHAHLKLFYENMKEASGLFASLINPVYGKGGKDV
jgi:GT2 family glycosyltransferase